MEQFITILKDETEDIVEKKSKFIANISCVENVEEAEAKIKDIKKHLALETTYEYLNNIKEIGYSKDEILELIKEVTKDEQ